MASYYSSYSNEYRLRLDITQGTQNVANNTTVVSWNLYLLSGNKSFNVYSTYNAKVNGVTSPSTTQTNVNIGFNTSVKLGSGSTTVTHNSDGTKSVPFSASFKTNSAAYYNGSLITPGTMSISGNFALTTIPRYAAITAFSASISGLSASLSWTADKTISQWRYSTNNGSSYSAWTTVNAKSGSKTLSVSAGTTYRFRVQVQDSASGLTTTSSTLSRTAPSYATITAFSASISGLTASLSWTADKTISQWRYSTNSGSSYSAWTTVNAKSGSKSLSVSAGTTYGFRVQVINSAGGLTTTSSTVSRTAPSAAKFTAFTVSINDRSATLNWTADKTISQWRYSSNSGSSYSSWITVNAKSGSRSISVTPGKSYGMRVQVKDSETGLTTTSSTLSRTATKTPSTLTLNTTSQNIGSGITWTINSSYDYTHKLAYYFGSTSGWFLGNDSAASTTTTGTWTLPTALASEIPNATSGSGTIVIRTFYGGVHVGTKSYTFTAKVPNTETWQPSVPNVTITDAGWRPTVITSYVQGKAKAKVVSSSTAKGGASISSYRVTVSGIGTYYGSNITSGFLTKSGTVTVTVRATDSRGYYQEKKSTITVVPYSPPKLTTYTALRSPNDQGTDLATSINFSLSSVNGQNGKQYRIRYRPTGGTWVALVNDGAEYARNITRSWPDILDVNKSYEVEFYITDSYSSVTQTRNIGTAFQLLDFNASGKGVAFGKVSEKDAFEVALPAEFEKGVAFLDTREVVSAPEGLPSRAISFEFKRNTSVGNPPNAAGTSYSHIINVAGWNSNEGSGGWPSQISVGAGGLAVRQATSATAWGAWTSMQPIYGSNSNGRYVRFGDGTQICWHSITWKGVVTNATADAVWTFPAVFSNAQIPVLSITAQNSSTTPANASILTAGEYSTVGNSSAVRGIAVKNTSSATRDITAHLIAIGRWE